jgi:hypothetical protein
MQSPVMGIPDLWRLLHDIDFAPDCVLKVAHIVDWIITKELFIELD